jgi:YidC/Oxa1 family membrane protein insertase
VALFLVQQKLFTPPAVDEEQKLQQKIMYFMTLFMGVMFYKVPAGLCIYFITSSLWGICERKMLKKPVPKADLPATTGKSDAGGDSKGGGSDGKRPPDSSDGGNRGGPSALERLLGMADAQLKQAKSSPSARKKAKK